MHINLSQLLNITAYNFVLMPFQADAETTVAPNGGGSIAPSEAAAILERKDTVQLEEEACLIHLIS